MNTIQDNDERLSALLDGELTDPNAQRVIQQLVGDPDGRARFAEYCTVGDFLRGHHADLPELTGKIMAALEEEPTVLAPVRRDGGRRPLLWLAAAACGILTWGLWGGAPRQENFAALASLQAPADVAPYLAAHQDYAQAVLDVPEMQFTRVSLSGETR